jgi:basic membrane protein A
MKRRIISLLLVVFLVGGLFVGCAGEEPAAEEETITAGMITDVGGLGDQSFNDSAWRGLGQAEEEFGIERKVLESETADDYAPNLTSFAEEDTDIIFGVGFLFTEAMTQAAEQFPEQKFAIVDAEVDAPNVASLLFAEHQGSFLVGVIAGMKTETDTVGFIGGLDMPLIQKFEYGFRAGVKAANPDAEVLVNYADSFEDAAIGKEIALVQNQEGADVIFHAAGGVGVGLINAAKENDFWAIGVDQDQSALAPDHVLCSMVKKVDNAVYLTTKDVVNGEFEGGVQIFDINNDGVGYSDEAGNLTEELVNAAEKYKQAMKDGEFTVPSTEEEFNSWTAPEL